MKKTIWYKTIKCPICKYDFEYARVRSKNIKKVKRDTDFMFYYDGVNPLYYQIVVCPQCYYADKHTSFEKITDHKIQKMVESLQERERIVSKFKFGKIRDFAAAIKSFELAAETGKTKKSGSDEIAGHYLRAAWIAREKEKKELETHYMTMAYSFYLKAYEGEYPKYGKLGEVGFIYLIGEIARRLDKYQEALKFFSKVIEHPDIKRFAEIERMTRDAWQETKNLRDEAKAKEEEENAWNI